MTPEEALRLLIETNAWKVGYWGRNPCIITMMVGGSLEFCEPIQKALKGHIRSETRYYREDHVHDYVWMPHDDDREAIANLMLEVIEDFDPYERKESAEKLVRGIAEEKIWQR